jgi:hypothetical protein
MMRLWGFSFAEVLFIASALAPAALLTVNLDGGADYTDIQAAIDASNESRQSVILVAGSPEPRPFLSLVLGFHGSL